MDDQTIKVRSDVLSRVLDGEAVLLELGSGTYFGLNEVGTEVWELIAEGRTVAAIRDALLERFDVDEPTLRRDLDALIKELLSRNLIELV